MKKTSSKMNEVERMKILSREVLSGNMSPYNINIKLFTSLIYENSY